MFLSLRKLRTKLNTLINKQKALERLSKSNMMLENFLCINWLKQSNMFLAVFLILPRIWDCGPCPWLIHNFLKCSSKKPLKEVSEKELQVSQLYSIFYLVNCRIPNFGCCHIWCPSVHGQYGVFPPYLEVALGGVPEQVLQGWWPGVHAPQFQAPDQGASRQVLLIVAVSSLSIIHIVTNYQNVYHSNILSIQQVFSWLRSLI